MEVETLRFLIKNIAIIMFLVLIFSVIYNIIHLHEAILDNKHIKEEIQETKDYTSRKILRKHGTNVFKDFKDDIIERILAINE